MKGRETDDTRALSMPRTSHFSRDLLHHIYASGKLRNSIVLAAYTGIIHCAKHLHVPG
ncbi:hypothetical protein BaRGS_00007954, partial [Batillaria attramentaria]